MSASKGFTLIELMITVAILGIIAAIAIPAYSGYVETARHTEGWNNLQAIKLAEEEYFLDNNSYFAGTDTAALASNSGGLWQPAESNAARNFDYAVTVTGNSYAASATGRGGSYKVPTSVVLTLE